MTKSEFIKMIAEQHGLKVVEFKIPRETEILDAKYNPITQRYEVEKNV